MMPEYLPVRKPGTVPTFKAGAAITGGQLVYLSANDTVLPTTAATAAWIGVAGADAAMNDPVVVYNGGTQACTATGTIAAGDLVVAAANGTVTTSASPAIGTVVGKCERGATAGNKARIKFSH